MNQPISELRDQADHVEAQSYTLERWPNGLYFIEAPNGEGTEVPEEAVAGVLAELFRKFF
jgi:hypothetical protein